MDRSLKFRAWDGKRMIYDGDRVKPSHLEGHQDKYFSGAIVTNHGVEIWFYESQLPDAKDGYFDHRTSIPVRSIQQYTGLTDKNGKEIYEGDVVRILYTDWVNQSRWVQGTVVYDSDRFVIDLGEHPMGGRNTGDLDPGTHGWREVVGNIYQHPELLEAPHEQMD